MWCEPTVKQLSLIPPLYSQENVPIKNQVIHMHFFIGGNDWYITEFDGKDVMFGFAILNGDIFNAEWRCISLSELKSVKVKPFGLEVEREIHWKKKKACEIGKIARCEHGIF